MTRYSDIEIQTAKNLLKNKFKWIARNKHGYVCTFSERPHKKDGYWLCNGTVEFISGKLTPIFQSVKLEDDEPTSLENIVHLQILDDTEKRYLGAVIRPFRDKVDLIYKVTFLESYGFQRIAIGLNDTSTDIVLPPFERESMYKGMKTGHGYTLEELGI